MNAKKAELTSQQIVLIIILILGFGFVLLIWSQLKLGDTATAEACHTSVILKKTMIEKFLVGGKLIDTPLKCQTEKICLTIGLFDKGCTGLGTKFQTVQISNKEELYRYLADSMASCWAMMGEAKGPMIFTREFTLIKEWTTKGVVCSIIDFSDNFKEEYPKINFAELYTYMDTKMPEKDLTYWQFLTNSPVSVVPKKAVSDKEPDIKTATPYSVIYLEYELSNAGNIVSAIGGGILGAQAGAVVGSIVPGAGTAVGAAGGFVLGLIGGSAGADAWQDLLHNNPEKYWASVILKPWESESLKSLHITEFESTA